MNHITLLPQEQQAFETVKASLTFMGCERILVLCASFNPTNAQVLLIILFAAEDLWCAENLLQESFCDDILHESVRVIFPSFRTLPGLYECEIIVPVEVQ